MSLNSSTNFSNVKNSSKKEEKANYSTVAKGDNVRTKRTSLLTLNIKNKESKVYSKSENEYIEDIIEKKNKEKENSKNNNKNELISKKNNILNLEDLKNKIQSLNRASIEELKKNNQQEFYIIHKYWLKQILDSNNYDYDKNSNIFDYIGSINNYDFLIDKQIINNALFLNEEDKKNIVILKPKYSLCYILKPFPINKQLWEFLRSTFGGGPELKLIKEKKINENGQEYYERDYSQYVKIHCIILPRKSHCVEKEIKNNIQTFYFFINKYTRIHDLQNYLDKLVRAHKNINLVDKYNYECWIDLNYYDYNQLYELIKDKISFIYKLEENPLTNLNLDEQEKKDLEDDESGFTLLERVKFGFKLFPLHILKNEQLLNIFPNQFTNYFEKNKAKRLIYLNNQIKESKIQMIDIDKIEIFNEFPELTIIIEQIKESIFYKNQNIKYRIRKCDNRPCENKGILTVSCECEKNFYCSLACKTYDKNNHQDKCPYLLIKYFKENTDQIMSEESLFGIKGIKNIGNTCYMNTALQCLSNCIELRNYFLFGNPQKDINYENILGFKGLVVYGFEYLIKKLWINKENNLDLSQFKSAMGLCNDRFRGLNQQDTHEFVTFLIDALHEDLNHVKNKEYIKKEEKDLDDEIKSKIEWNNYLRRNQSILVDLFYGLFKSTVTCTECKKSCIDFNIFSSLSLNLKNYNKKPKINNDKITQLNINNKDNNKDKDKEKDKNKENNNNNNNVNNNKENKENNNIQNNKESKDNQTIKIKIEKVTLPLCKNEMNNINESPMKKEEVLVGGKQNALDLSSHEKDKEKEKEKEIIKEKNNESNKIRIVFFPYSNEEKTIQFFFPFKDKIELPHKVLLYKISRIFNKNPYSLYMYHSSLPPQRNVSYVFNLNDCYKSEKNEILYISEINHDVIVNNINEKTNRVFYDSSNSAYMKTKYRSREEIEQYFNKNKQKIIEIINSDINENDIEFDKDLLDSHSLNLQKVFQLTLKNFIIENNSPKIFNPPKIVVFPKDITIFDLYYQIIMKKKNIIFDNIKNAQEGNIANKIFDKNEIMNNYFTKATVLDLENFNDKTTPFYLALELYKNDINNINNINQKGEQIYLLLNEQVKNKKIKEIIPGISDQLNFPNEQIILNIYWNPKYNSKIKEYLRAEKMDNFIYKLIGITSEENINKNNISNNPLNLSYKKQTDEEAQKSLKDRYNKIYDNFVEKNKNNINVNNNNSNNTNNGGNEKKENFIPIINTEISLEDTFEFLREEEILEENNEWFCEKCKKKQKALKKIEIYNAPKILIIQIKRFSQRNKINTKVDFPLKNLDISKYILSQPKNRQIKYDLFAVANHYGSLDYGHYTSFCLNSIDNKWYEFNDSMVREIKNESDIVTQSAYVLFYRQQGLSKLNWKNIYNKKFIDIDITNPKSLIDYNYDFENNKEESMVESESENDINEYDKIIKSIWVRKKQKKINNNNIIQLPFSNMKIEEKKDNNNNNNIDNNVITISEDTEDGKDTNQFLNKKRASDDK